MLVDCGRAKIISSPAKKKYCLCCVIVSAPAASKLQDDWNWVLPQPFCQRQPSSQASERICWKNFGMQQKKRSDGRFRCIFFTRDSTIRAVLKERSNSQVIMSSCPPSVLPATHGSSHRHVSPVRVNQHIDRKKLIARKPQGTFHRSRLSEYPNFSSFQERRPNI